MIISDPRHTDQSAQISHKQGRWAYVYVIMKTMCPGYHHKDFGNSWGHDVWFMCPSTTQVTYHKANIMVTTRRAHCFHGS